MSEGENKVLIRRWIEEGINKGNLAIIDEVFDPDVVSHHQLVGDFRGIEDGPKRAVTTFREAFPDIHFSIEDLITEDDKVVTRWTASGTHDGEFLGIPATGKKIQLGGIYIYRIADGKIVEVWVSLDLLGPVLQLGPRVMPQ
jgi:steroid delta-isomerase-like uncharacterized protein